MTAYSLFYSDKIAGSIDISNKKAIVILNATLCFLFAKNSDIKVPSNAHKHVPIAVTRTKINTINGRACQMLVAVSVYAAIELITTVRPFGFIHWKKAAV